MVRYPLNNLLHASICSIVIDGINMVIEKKSEIVRKYLFEKFDILDFIQKYSVEEYYCNKEMKKKVRKGYIGFLTNMARKIEEGDNFI